MLKMNNCLSIKNIIYRFCLIVIAVLVSYSCKEDQDKTTDMKPDTICEVNNPLTQLNWLALLKEQLDGNCVCEQSIFQAKYQNQVVFYSEITDPVCDYIFNVSIFNCQGQVVKNYDYDQFEEFNKEVIDRSKIYSCTRSN